MRPINGCTGHLTKVDGQTPMLGVKINPHGEAAGMWGMMVGGYIGRCMANLFHNLSHQRVKTPTSRTGPQKIVVHFNWNALQLEY